MQRSFAQTPSASHICLDEDTLAVRAATPEGLAATRKVCAGCRACEKLLDDVQRMRELERELHDTVYNSRTTMQLRSRSLATRGDELLASVVPGSNPSLPHIHSPPPVVRGYQVLDELHRGGQGVVYRAVQETTNRPAAIKLLLAGTLASLRERYRFEREIEIASSLRHPHIVAVFDAVSTSDGRVGYAMDLVEGSPIDQWGATSRGSQSLQVYRRVSLDLMAKVCRAVQFAHTRGVIHRDLKPGNVLVDATNEPRLLDFGLARDLRPRKGSQAGNRANSLTMPGEFLGTPQYAAPEQLELDPSEVDGRADVYSLGMMLYQLACGRLPYTVDGSLKSIIESVCHTLPPRPSHVAMQERLAPIDTDLETIILKALAKDRERRYQTALELAQDIELLLRGHAIQARRESTLYVLRKWFGAHKIETGAIAGLSLAVLGAVVGGTILSARASEARSREAIERAQREEQAIRAQAVATVIAEILPPPDQSTDAAPSRWLEENLLDLREAVDAGWLSDRPELAAQVQSVLSDIYALRGTRSGWFAEATARNAKQLLQEEYGESDPRVLRIQEAEVAALVARKRNFEGAQLAELLIAKWSALGPQWTSQVQHSRILLAQAQAQLMNFEQARLTLKLALPESPGGLSTSQIAHGWHLLAEVLLEQGDLPGAWQAASEALRVRMVLRRDTDTDVIASLLQTADVLTRAPQLATKQTPPADVLQTLAHALRAAEGDRSLTQLTSQGPALLAVKIWLFGSNSMEEAESLALIGNSFRREYAWEDAAEWTARAGSALQASLGKPSLATMNLYSAAAEGYRMTLRPTSEVALSMQAVTQARALSDGVVEPLFRGAVYRDAASALSRAGRHQEAISLMEESLDCFERATGGQGHVVATACSRLAEIHLIAGNNDKALNFANRAYDLAATVTSMPIDQRIDMCGTFARALVANGDGPRATAVSNQQLEYFESIPGETTWRSTGGNSCLVANFWWTAACAARLMGDSAEYIRLHALATNSWNTGSEFVAKTYGMPPETLPPWQQYPHPSLQLPQQLP